MKIIKTEEGYINEETGELVTWRDIDKHTKLGNSHSRLLLKKLAQTGVAVEESNLLRWRDDMVLIWHLEKMGVTVPDRSEA